MWRSLINTFLQWQPFLLWSWFVSIICLSLSSSQRSWWWDWRRGKAVQLQTRIQTGLSVSIKASKELEVSPKFSMSLGIERCPHLPWENTSTRRRYIPRRGALRWEPCVPGLCSQLRPSMSGEPHHTWGSSSLKQRSFFSQDMRTAPGPKPIYSGEKSHK